jgi:hypothetical protein
MKTTRVIPGSARRIAEQKSLFIVGEIGIRSIRVWTRGLGSKQRRLVAPRGPVAARAASAHRAALLLWPGPSGEADGDGSYLSINE